MLNSLLCLALLLPAVITPEFTLAADAGAAPLSGRALGDESALAAAVYARAASPMLWSARHQLSAQASELLGLLRAADRYGLRREDFGLARLDAAAAALGPESKPEEWASFDQALTHAALRLVSELHYGRVDPRAAGFELPETHADLDLVASVVALAASPRVTDAIAAVEPHFYHYQLLKAALQRYRALAAATDLSSLPTPPQRSVHVGEVYAGAPLLRRLLLAEGDLSLAAAAPMAATTVLDPELVAALARFQDRHGLSADGHLGAATLAALRTPMAVRVRQIELTLERWRWLPPFTSPPIIVNVPQFRLFAFATLEDRAASILQMPVIVGEAYPRKETPIFVGALEYVIFRPYWDVPRSITTREMLPKIEANAGYLAHNHLEIVAGENEDAPALAATPARIAALAAGDLRLRQQPGEDNALGLIKFIFPNAHDVYLHSTPARGLFTAARRAFSHGCIRVSQPAALAAFVLRATPGDWTVDRVTAAMQQGPANQRVALRQSIPVMVLYGTVMATEAGPVQFFDDLYGQDRKLERLLELPTNPE
jgi:murein L,D-transpeptidase YcbB/YkuD